MVLESDHRERGGEAAGADDHRVTGVEPGRQCDQPLRRDSGVLGVPAVAGHPDGVTVRDDLGARREAGSVLDEHPGQIDPRHDRRDAGDAAGRRRGQPVFVVDARPVHLDEDPVVGELVDAHRHHPALDLLAIGHGAKGPELLDRHGDRS